MLIRLHREDPQQHSVEGLAEKFKVNQTIVASLLKHVSLPKVLILQVRVACFWWRSCKVWKTMSNDMVGTWRHTTGVKFQYFGEIKDQGQKQVLLGCHFIPSMIITTVVRRQRRLSSKRKKLRSFALPCKWWWRGNRTFHQRRSLRLWSRKSKSRKEWNEEKANAKRLYSSSSSSSIFSTEGGSPAIDVNLYFFLWLCSASPWPTVSPRSFARCFAICSRT